MHITYWHYLDFDSGGGFRVGNVYNLLEVTYISVYHRGFRY